MRTLIAAAAGALATWLVLTLTSTPDVIRQIEYRDTIVVEETVTTLDLEELRTSIEDLDRQLYAECVEVIHHYTGDPHQGIRNLVARHYEGDACKAAAEAQRGEW